MAFPRGPRRTPNGTPRLPYLDVLRDDVPPLPRSPSLHSPNSSLSSTTSYMSLRSECNPAYPRPFSAMEDNASIHSNKSVFAVPLRRLRSTASRVFRRRREVSEVKQVKELTTSLSSGSTGSLSSSSGRQVARRPSLPMLNTFNFAPSPKSSTTRHQSQDSIEPPRVESQRCYYFAARHCPGWVLNGNHGDACESCLEAGFFGSP